MKERFSNVELLKCVAIIIILLSHSTPRYEIIYPIDGFLPDNSSNSVVDVFSVSLDVKNIFLQFFTSLGQLGNSLFIICSSYFLIDSNSVKRKKIWFIVSSTVIISLLSFFICMGLGWQLNLKALFESVFPIATYNNWFVCCYLIFYMIHPLLNICINYLSKRRHLFIIIVGLYMFSIWNMMYPKAFLYFHLSQFIIIYFIVAYLKIYCKMDNYSKSLLTVILLIGGVGLLLHTYAVNYIHTYIFAIPIEQNSLNPWVLIISFSGFYLFKQFHFHSKAINYLSSLSLLIYLIDENYVIRHTIKPLFWYNQYNSGDMQIVNLIICVSFFTILSFIACSLLASIYMFLYKRVINKCCDFFDAVLVNAYSRFEKIFL